MFAHKGSLSNFSQLVSQTTVFLFVHFANKQIPFLKQLILNMIDSFCNVLNRKSVPPKEAFIEILHRMFFMTDSRNTKSCSTESLQEYHIKSTEYVFVLWATFLGTLFIIISIRVV